MLYVWIAWCVVLGRAIDRVRKMCVELCGKCYSDSNEPCVILFHGVTLVDREPDESTCSERVTSVFLCAHEVYPHQERGACQVLGLQGK